MCFASPQDLSGAIAPPRRAGTLQTPRDSEGGVHAGTPNTNTPGTVDPTTQAFPDLYDSAAVNARQRQQLQLQSIAGYRSTFTSGPRGPGGPTQADQRTQLSPPPATGPLPYPGPPPPNPNLPPRAPPVGGKPGGTPRPGGRPTPVDYASPDIFDPTSGPVQGIPGARRKPAWFEV